MQLTAATRDAILGNLIATGGAFDPAATFLGVALSITNNGLGTVLADVSLGPGGMANRQAVGVWGTPYTMNDGRRVVDAPAREFRPASSAEACVIGAWYVANGTLKAFQQLPEPVALPDQNRAMTLVFRLTVDPTGRWDASVVLDG